MSDIQNNRLSYSQLRLFSECGKKYEFYYNHKLREKTKSGALFFGTAFDKATEAVLQDRSVNEYEIFDKVWTHQDLNGKHTYLPDSTRVVYAASDMDFDLLRPEDIKFLTAKMAELLPSETDIEKAFAACAAAKKQRAFKTFSEEQNKFLNLCNWCCLRRKGHLMLKANREKVLPRIKRVVGTQVKVELANGTGDSLLGYADLHCIWEDGREIILDYKTSSIEYDETAVLTSPQLTIYGYALGVKVAGFLVFRKGIIKNKVKVCSSCGFDGSGARHKTCPNEVGGKRCGAEWIETISPEVDVQVIIDTIPERTTEVVIENVEMVNKAISSGLFTRNFSSCKGPFGMCPYSNLCFKGDDSDLEKM